MLFIIFVILTPIVVWLLLHFTSSRQKSDAEDAEPEVQIELCAMCQNEFPMPELLEKEVGGYGRVYCFCGTCIENLYHEYQNKTDIKIGE